MRFAITRDVSSRIGQCELTHIERVPIDYAKARGQHEAYGDALSESGWTLIRLPGSADLPDSLFVEDTAVITKEVAITTNPGAHSRRREIASVAEILGRYREIKNVHAPVTLDGGDVLILGSIRVEARFSTNKNGHSRSFASRLEI
jgi:dimethylargininase